LPDRITDDGSTTLAPVNTNPLEVPPNQFKPSVLMLTALYRSPGGVEGAAGVRAHAMASGLRAAGHAVTVVCARGPGNERRVERGVEVVPAAWLDAETRGRRMGIDLRELATPREPGGPPRTSRLRAIAARLAVPDRYLTWVPPAVVAAGRAGRRCDVLMSTGPVSAHLVARAVRAGRPWVADFNDIWALDPGRESGALHDAVDVMLEDITIRGAAHLTTTTDSYGEELSRRHGKPVTVLRSGFDPADFPTPAPPTADGRVELVFVGTLYHDQNIGGLLSALAAGHRGGWLSPDKLIVRFIGRLTDRAAFAADRQGVADFVSTSDPIARPELIDRMMSADALLLPVHDLFPTALPMRLIEYIGAGRPILVLANKADRERQLVVQLVTSHHLGRVVADQQELEALLRSLVADRNALPDPDPAERDRFTWNETMQSLVSIVNSL
jgi:glycosyltransferase involved in cell wall biosynthesis